MYIYIHFICMYGEVNGNPFQYSCLENSMYRGALRATVHEITKSWKRVTNTHIPYKIYILFFRFFSPIGYYKIKLSIVPCAMQ